MKEYSCSDIALIHPPALIHTKKYAVFPLPRMLGHIGSPYYSSMYPVYPRPTPMPLGFSVLKDYIERNSDYSVAIYSLADLKYLFSEAILNKFLQTGEKGNFAFADFTDVIYPHLAADERIINQLKLIKADLFALDLHWVNFSPGAIQTLKLIKKLHPGSYTVVGGLTATYFKNEIMKLYTCIDFLIEGDGALPLLKLIEQIKGKKIFSGVPNLIYRVKDKCKNGPVRLLNDFRYIQQHGLFGMGGIPTARGCPLECSSCGGSQYFYKTFFHYRKIHPYSVEAIMKRLLERRKSEVFLIHDPFITLGRKKWGILLEEIRRNRLDIHFAIEFFRPHAKPDIIKIAEKLPGTLIHISPESFDEEVRSFHKNMRYSNEELGMNIDLIDNIDDLSMNIWFMAGLAKETRQSIDKTLSFIRKYYMKSRHTDKNGMQYIELIFLDPGSLAFDFPRRYGYRLLYKTFSEHMKSFEMPIFKYHINFESSYHTREELFELFLYMHEQMDKIYYEHNIINKIAYDRSLLYNRLLRKYAFKYDEAMLEENYLARDKQFEKIGSLFHSDLRRLS